MNIHPMRVPHVAEPRRHNQVLRDVDRAATDQGPSAMTRVHTHNFRGRGFTLVELLVVVSIIAMLIALLLPALGKARAVAQQVACQSDMRQIVLAFGMYAEDNEGYLPGASTHINPLTWEGVTRDAYVPWYSAMYAGRYFGNTRVGASAFAPSQQGSSSKVIYCPSQGPRKTDNYVGIGYSNVWNNKFTKTNGGPTKLSQFTWPTRTVMLLDVPSSGVFQYIDQHVGSSNIPIYRHNDAWCNAGFSDGHTAAYTDLESNEAAAEVTVRAR